MAGFVTSIESLNIFKSPTSEFGFDVSAKEKNPLFYFNRKSYKYNENAIRSRELKKVYAEKRNEVNISKSTSFRFLAHACAFYESIMSHIRLLNAVLWQL